MRKKYGIFFILAVVIFSSCSREYPCAKADLQYRLIGFSDAEADTIIIRRFQKNTTTLIDSFVFDPENPIRFNRFGDTLIMGSFSGTALLYSDNDYQLYFPVASRTISITELTEPQSYGKRRDIMCVNQFTSCKIDGQISSIDFPHFIYLRK